MEIYVDRSGIAVRRLATRVVLKSVTSRSAARQQEPAGAPHLPDEKLTGGFLWNPSGIANSAPVSINATATKVSLRLREDKNMSFIASGYHVKDMQIKKIDFKEHGVQINFTSPPHVLVSSFWKDGAVGHPETIVEIEQGSFTLNSGNAAADYYVRRRPCFGTSSIRQLRSESVELPHSWKSFRLAKSLTFRDDWRASPRNRRPWTPDSPRPCRTMRRTRLKLLMCEKRSLN